MQALLDRIAALGHWAYVAEALLIFAEDALFFGFVLPAETVLAFCGFLAHQHVLSGPVVAAIAVGAAILGDQAGFEIGRHFGDRITQSRLGRTVGERRWKAAEALVAERGGVSVFIGRWAAFLRALVPTTSGLLGMRWTTFTPWNAAGGLLWGIAWTAVGYAAGASWQVAARRFGELSAALGIVAIGALALTLWKRRAAARHS
jgi:membrane protein DedA with SNARE-associated domain